jgi:hypothetical protein
MITVSACRFVRKLRGGTQAHLLEATDGRCYAVKFINNPNGRRILINEWLAHVCLRHLGIACPETAIVGVSREFLEDAPNVFMRFGSDEKRPEPGWHFGSLYPGHPEHTAVYDYLPDTVLLTRVDNLAQLIGVLAFDKWTANADARQAIFVRTKVREYVPESRCHPLRVGFVSLVIDHEHIFHGREWTFTDIPASGLYLQSCIYDRVQDLNAFEPWLARIGVFPEQAIHTAMSEVPATWLAGEESALDAVLDQLFRRRSMVPDLLRRCLIGPHRSVVSGAGEPRHKRTRDR